MTLPKRIRLTSELLAETADAVARMPDLAPHWSFVGLVLKRRMGKLLMTGRVTLEAEQAIADMADGKMPGDRNTRHLVAAFRSGWSQHKAAIIPGFEGVHPMWRDVVSSLRIMADAVERLSGTDAANRALRMWVRAAGLWT